MAAFSIVIVRARTKAKTSHFPDTRASPQKVDGPRMPIQTSGAWIRSATIRIRVLYFRSGGKTRICRAGGAPGGYRKVRSTPLKAATPLSAMALEYLFAPRAQFGAVLLQALLNRRIVPELRPAKAGSIARTRLLLLWGSGVAALR